MEMDVWLDQLQYLRVSACRVCQVAEQKAADKSVCPAPKKKPKGDAERKRYHSKIYTKTFNKYKHDREVTWARKEAGRVARLETAKKIDGAPSNQ